MDFADPIGGAGYAFCLYVAGSLEVSASVPPGTAWKQLGDKGYKYKDKNGTSDGVQKVLVKGTGVPNKSKGLLKGKGSNLPFSGLTMPLGSPVVAQLRNNDTGVCLQGTFAMPIKSTAEQYKAKQ
jgi:hypothetical protein